MLHLQLPNVKVNHHHMSWLVLSVFPSPQADMDFNAGRYQEGTPMPVLGRELFDSTVKVRTVASVAWDALVTEPRFYSIIC